MPWCSTRSFMHTSSHLRLTWSLDTSAHLPIPNVVPSISWDANSALGEAHAPLGYLRILGGIVDQFILSSVINRNHSISLPTQSPMDSTPICKKYETSETYKWEWSSRCCKYRVMCIALCDSVSHIKISVRAKKKCICIASAQKITKTGKQYSNKAQKKNTHTHTHLLIRACQKNAFQTLATKVLSSPGQDFQISPSIPRSSLYLTAGFLVQHSTSLAPSRHRAAQPKASLRQKPSLPRGWKTAVKPEVKIHQRTQRSWILGGKLNLPKKNDHFSKR